MTKSARAIAATGLLCAFALLACCAMLAVQIAVPGSFSQHAYAAKKLSSSKVKISSLNKVYAYTGKKVKPKPKVTYKGKLLKRGKDYKLAYASNVKVGTAKLAVKGIGSYKGKVKKTFKIRYSLAAKGKVSLVRTSYAYTGKTYHPAATVKYAGKKLSVDKDYTLSYTGGKKTGTYYAVAKGKGSYAFKAVKKFTIKASGGKIIDVSYWDGDVNWAKVAPRVDAAILRSHVTYSRHRSVDDLDYDGSAQDVRYDEYATNCEKYKIPYGVYGYMIFRSEQDAVRQAELLWSRSFSNGHAPLFVALDLEDEELLKQYFDPVSGQALKKAKKLSSNVEVQKWSAACANRLRELAAQAGYARLHVGVYVGGDSYYQYGYSTEEGQKTLAEQFDFVWTPRYGKNDGNVPKAPYLPTAPADYDMWQYTSCGKISGIAGNVDISLVKADGPHGHSMSWYMRR